MMQDKLNVEIWSDLICPFCYIGKRKFENALSQLDASENIEITWKSFQLAPDMKTNTSISIDEYLAIHKGFSIDKAREMNAHVTQKAKQEGLIFNFDKSVVANTRSAHQMLHFAKASKKQNETKERLLKAYFTEGKNIDDKQTLLELASELDLDVEGLNHALTTNIFEHEVDADIIEAQNLGVRGVPFFVFNRSHAISGAQPVEVFIETMQQVFSQMQQEIIATDGVACATDGECE